MEDGIQISGECDLTPVTAFILFYEVDYDYAILVIICRALFARGLFSGGVFRSF